MNSRFLLLTLSLLNFEVVFCWMRWFRGTFRRVVKKKSTENFKWQPYATTLLGTSPWTFYGLLKPGGLLVVTVNGIGSLLQAIYVALFLIYAPRETRVIASSGSSSLSVEEGVESIRVGCISLFEV